MQEKSQNLIPTPVEPQKKALPKKKKIVNVLVSITSVLLIVLVPIITLSFFFLYLPGKKLYDQVNLAKDEAMILKQFITDKDLKGASDSIVKLESQVNQVEKKYSYFRMIGILPYFKNYYSDGNELLNITKEGLDTGKIVIKAIEPYQDFLGLKGSGTDAGKTTEDRINFLTQSIEGLTPYLDTISQKLSTIEKSISKIDPNRYPEIYNDVEVRSLITKAKNSVSEVNKLIGNGSPLLSKTSWLLGNDKPRNYLIVFQNDTELRPTGGFWTAYAVIKIDKGKITPISSDDIYTLDSKINSTTPAPRPIRDYHINVPYWYVRDMNISPDFPTSIKLFLDKYQQAYGTKNKIDAIIGLDTNVLVGIVEVLGKVPSPIGVLSAEPDKRCDGCPQIIYELEWTAGRPRNYIEKDRKGFLGPLMNSMLLNVMGSEKSKIGPLAQKFIDNINQKHLLFYFIDPEMQKSAELANIAGNIVNTDQNTDYLHLNDSNMSSAKTNLFIKQKIKHDLTVKDGQVTHKVSVTYTNPSKASNCNLEKGDLCLNAPKYRNWFRFYTPVGSKLTKMTGSEVDPLSYEELNKQVFEGFYGNKFFLAAESSAKTSVEYTSSVKPSSSYKLLLQKQPGTKPVDYEITLNGKSIEKFSWVSDKTINIPL